MKRLFIAVAAVGAAAIALDLVIRAVAGLIAGRLERRIRLLDFEPDDDEAVAA